MSAAPRTVSHIALVGASSLLGKELSHVLKDRHFPAGDIVLLDASILPGTLTEAAGEPAFFRALTPESFEGARLAFFAGPPAETEQNWAAARNAGADVIDLSGALFADTSAMVRIPALDSMLPPLAARADGQSSPIVYISPPAAVIIACTLALALQPISVRPLALLLFPPVSESGQEGVDELEGQAAGLLSFREISRSVFDAQVAFNLLAQYGKDSQRRLADARAAMERDASRCLAGRAPVPAIQLVQAPVFYGYAFAAYAELAAPLTDELARRIEVSLASFGVRIAAQGEVAPSSVSVAGETEIHLARLEARSGTAGGVWLWGAADNLRLAATNAVRIAEECIAK